MEKTELVAKTEIWNKVLVGKRFEPDLESKWAMQFKPLDGSVSNFISSLSSCILESWLSCGWFCVCICV